jgi:hypothetical protein
MAFVGGHYPVRLEFQRYIGIDYFGAQTPSSSLKSLRVYAAELEQPEREKVDIEGWIFGVLQSTLLNNSARFLPPLLNWKFTL